MHVLLSNIRKLAQRRERERPEMELNVSFVVSMDNYTAMPQMLQLAKDLNVTGVNFQNLMDFSTAFTETYRPIYDSDEKALQVIRSLVKPVHFKRLILPVVLYSKRPKNFTRGKNCCHYPFATIGINTDGDTNPCCNVNTSEKYGNIFKDKDFWNNDSYQNIRKTLIEGKFPFKLCETCSVYGKEL